MTLAVALTGESELYELDRLTGQVRTIDFTTEDNRVASPFGYDDSGDRLLIGRHPRHVDFEHLIDPEFDLVSSAIWTRPGSDRTDPDQADRGDRADRGGTISNLGPGEALGWSADQTRILLDPDLLERARQIAIDSGVIPRGLVPGQSGPDRLTWVDAQPPHDRVSFESTLVSPALSANDEFLLSSDLTEDGLPTGLIRVTERISHESGEAVSQTIPVSMSLAGTARFLPPEARPRDRSRNVAGARSGDTPRLGEAPHSGEQVGTLALLIDEDDPSHGPDADSARLTWTLALRDVAAQMRDDPNEPGSLSLTVSPAQMLLTMSRGRTEAKHVDYAAGSREFALSVEIRKPLGAYSHHEIWLVKRDRPGMFGRLIALPRSAHLAGVAISRDGRFVCFGANAKDLMNKTVHDPHSFVVADKAFRPASAWTGVIGDPRRKP